MCYVPTPIQRAISPGSVKEYARKARDTLTRIRGFTAAAFCFWLTANETEEIGDGLCGHY